MIKEHWTRISIGSIYTEHGALVASVHGDLTKSGDEYFEVLRLRSNAIAKAPDMKDLIDDLAGAKPEDFPGLRARAIALAQWIDLDGKHG